MESVSRFFNDNIVAVFFLHGLAIFLMGVLVTLESRRSASSGLPRILAPLGAFGLLAGLSEWLQMFTAIPRSTAGPDIRLALHQIQPSNCLECHQGSAPADYSSFSGDELYYTFGFILLLMAVLFLVYFGSKLLHHTGFSGWWVRYLPVGLFALWALASGLALLTNLTPSSEWRSVANTLCRYFLYFPGAMLAALGLWRLRKQVALSQLPHAARLVRSSAGLFAFSGLFDGLIVAPGTFPPASLLNYASFFGLVGIPVQLFRAAIVIGIAYLVVRILRDWDAEQTRRMMEALKERLRLQQEATEIEARQREQVEHFNRELQKERQLRDEVLRRIITAQEDERKRVARELHDEMGQTLTALATGLEAISMALEANPQRAKQQLGRLQGFAQTAVTDVHRLIADLRPALLDDLGLPSALRWYATMASEQGGFEIRLETSHWERRLPAYLETVLFRIAQEALTNVVKHAAARCVRIRLACNPEVILEVEDDGKGFDVEAVLDQNGGREAVGLLGMRERAVLARGRLELISQPGQGCRIVVHFPVSQ